MRRSLIFFALCIISMLVLISFDSNSHSAQALFRRRRRRSSSPPPPPKRSNQNEIDTLGILTAGYASNPTNSKFTSLLPTYGVSHFRLIDRSNSEYKHVQCRIFLKNRVVIVAFRGTIENKLNDWKTNFQIKKETFDATRLTSSGSISSSVRGKVHRGFKNEYKLLQTDIFNAIKGYISQGYSVVFSGHSQGGAIASLAATHYAVMYPQSRSKLHLVTIGAPRSGNGDFASFASSVIPYAKRFVTYRKGLFGAKHHDPVTEVPMKILGYRSFGQQVDLRCSAYPSVMCHPTSKYFEATNFF